MLRVKKIIFLHIVKEELRDLLNALNVYFTSTVDIYSAVEKNFGSAFRSYFCLYDRWKHEDYFRVKNCFFFRNFPFNILHSYGDCIWVILKRLNEQHKIYCSLWRICTNKICIFEHTKLITIRIMQILIKQETAKLDFCFLFV